MLSVHKLGEAVMHLTDYHAKYFAHELTKCCASDSVEKLAGTLVDAQVDLNPHQVEAALFAFKSPLSKGAILADEVGLGKTIEAGLVLSQKWAERKRRLLVITPANLRKQWHQELQEKFFLPCRILEAKFYNAAIKQGNDCPFHTEDIIICSYQFARSKAADIRATPWDLVVIDEAHRLRNVYKPSNVIANTLKHALQDTPKLLLTATPLQNSLLELYGLVSFIDERTFGDLKSFREQFTNLNNARVFETLKARLQPVCKRTLRRQVLAYVPFTKRHPIVQPFVPKDSEDLLYHLVSDYLQRDNLQALPVSQRSLMTLVLRKLLASSTFAIAGALESLSRRLQAQLQKTAEAQNLEEELAQDFEALDAMAEEWEEDAAPESLSKSERIAIKQEIADLERFHELAVSITHNDKGEVLLTALQTAFAKAEELGAARKAIVFTESRRTQDYLLRVLADSPYKDGVVLFNGSNSDDKSRQIYADWLHRHADTDHVTGSRTADMRSALVDYFQEQGQIMIATEAGAEGINLQFCSLVVNYDLPWNPQRIEQRIGRCHRYGQKYDVVVVNFLNQKNAADQRVFQLLVEDYLIFAALPDNGQPLDEEQARRLLGIPAQECCTLLTPLAHDSLISLTALRQEAVLNSISQRNAAFFEAEANKLDGWADDLKAGLERDIKELDRQIREARRAATAALTLEEKLDAQKRIKAIEAQRNATRRALFDTQDDIDRRREQLIGEIEGKLEQKTTLLELFTIRWKLV